MNGHRGRASACETTDVSGCCGGRVIAECHSKVGCVVAGSDLRLSIHSAFWSQKSRFGARSRGLVVVLLPGHPHLLALFSHSPVQEVEIPTIPLSFDIYWLFI